MSPKKYVVMAKVEVTQFTDPVPTSAANAILCSNLKLTPLRVENEDRGIFRPYYGNSEQIPVMEEAVVEFDVEIAGSGTAGTAPGWGVLLRGCAFAETIVAVTSAAYNPVSSAFETITLYVNRDGRLAKLTGAVGNVTIDMAAKKIPHFHFRFVGKYVAISDVALPASPVYTIFQSPKASIPAWTGTLTVDGYAAKVSAFTADPANEISHALWMNQETLGVTDRKPKGSITVQAVSVATKDYFTLVRNATLVVFTLTHGNVAGNIVKLDAPKMQLVDHTEAVFENNMADQFNATFNPNSGNDEFIITAT
jgi:hypothetical protein